MFYGGQVTAANKIVIDKQKNNANNKLYTVGDGVNVDTQNSGGNREDAIDYDKLFHAVAVAESGNCTSRIAKKTNNCTSIMGWKNGKRFIRKFSSIEENKKAFIDLWERVYKRVPDYKIAVKYTGNDKANIWLKTVLLHYKN